MFEDMDQIGHHLEIGGWRGLLKVVVKKKIREKKGHAVRRRRKRCYLGGELY